MGRTAPPFTIPGPPEPSSFLQSPSSPRHYLSLFLFLSRFHLLEEKLSFSRSHTNIAQTSCIPFSFRFTPAISRFLVLSVSFHLSRHLPCRNPSFFVLFFSYVHTLLAIMNVFSVHDERQRDGASVCTLGERAPLLAGTKKVPSNFITHRGTISIMKYFGEYFGPRVNSIRLQSR